MATKVIMPQMGESIAEGTVTKWLKKVGDRVERDEPLFEISTDKVDAEIPSPAAGVLTQILVNENETVEVNTVVAEIDGEGADVQAEAPAAEAPTAAPAPVAAAAPPSRLPAQPEAAGSARRRQGGPFLPFGVQPRQRTQHRPPECSGDRPQRPRQQEGHSRLHCPNGGRGRRRAINYSYSCVRPRTRRQSRRLALLLRLLSPRSLPAPRAWCR